MTLQLSDYTTLCQCPNCANTMVAHCELYKPHQFGLCPTCNFFDYYIDDCDYGCVRGLALAQTKKFLGIRKMEDLKESIEKRLASGEEVVSVPFNPSCYANLDTNLFTRIGYMTLAHHDSNYNDYYHAVFPSVGDHVRFQKESLQWALKRGQDNLSWIAGSKWDNYSLYPLFFIMREVGKFRKKYLADGNYQFPTEIHEEFQVIDIPF